MLAELPDLRPDYVIFYDLSRVARDEFDAFWILREIKAAGAKLESTLERITDDDSGMLTFAVMAGVNAHRSRSDGKKAKMGMERKHADGGTNGRTRIGYLNTRDFVGGREVRVVGFDQERAPLVQMGFELFATGNYSISELHTVLEEAGLRKRETPTRGPQPLSRSQVHRMLRDDYYIGVVKWGGTTNPNGRHTPLIDVTTLKRCSSSWTRLVSVATAHASTNTTFVAHCSADSVGGVWSSTASEGGAVSTTTSAVSVTRAREVAVAVAISKSRTWSGRWSATTRVFD